MKNITLLFLGFVFFFACKQNSLNYLTKKDKQPTTIVQSDEFDNWLNEKVQTTMKENKIPAISIGIIRNGKLERSQGFGIMKRGNGAKVNGKSIYQIGSLSKTFTGIIANNLIIEGKLNPENGIDFYLDKVLNDQSKIMYHKVKLKHLMNHSAGIPRSASLISRERKGNDYWIKGYNEKSFLTDLNQVKLIYEPGTKWEYSNFAYIILGYICEQASGESYDDLLKKYITDKFDMQNTVVTLSEIQKDLMPTPYMKRDKFKETKAFIMGKATPASALFSNIDDLSKLMLEHLSTYRALNNTSTKNPLLLTNNVVATGMIEGLSYGTGLFMDGSKSGVTYGHGGDIDGFASDYRFAPDENSGVIILTSSGGRWVHNFTSEIFDMLRALDLERE